MSMLIPLFHLAAALAAAQDIQDPQTEARRAKAAVRAEASRAKTAAQAAEAGLADDQDATWEQVLARPDDKQLNYRFARTQVRSGDVKGASATLERLLILDPNQPRVRLFYALVLLRLDNAAEARREAEAVLKTNPPEALRAEAQAALKQAEKSLRRTKVSGRLGIGVEHDTNRNASPASGQSLFAGTPVTLSASSRRRADPSFIAVGAVELRRDLGFQAGHEAYASLSYYRADQSKLKTLALQAHSFEAGAALKHRRWELTPAFLFDHVMLSGDTFLRDRGASLRLENKRRGGVVLYADLRGLYQDYAQTFFVRTAEERNGPQWDFSLGGMLPLSPRWRTGASYTHTEKAAARDYNGFRRDLARVDATWLPGRGMFVNGALAFGADRYDTPDTAVSRSLRRDSSLRASATFGAPLSLLHPKLKDLMWTAGYEHYRNMSNLINYDYFNNRITSMLTYRWEAGF